MARTTGTAVENNLSKGLVTEATSLTFPENAVSDALNVIFTPKGNTIRRDGFDLEESPSYISYTPQTGVVREFFWDSSGFVNNTLYLVLQIGSVIHFFSVNNSENLSANKINFSIDLSEYKTEIAGRLEFSPCSFATGMGFLFIANPMTEPLYVKWDSTEEEFVVSEINLQIRDTEGIEDGLEIDENPTTLSKEHEYNLKNQGWFKQVRVGSANNEV